MKNSLKNIKTFLLIAVILVASIVGYAANITFNSPPQDAGESSTVLQQRVAVALWNLNQAAGSGGAVKVTAGGPASGQSVKTFTSNGGVSINTGATTNVYTVTTGKTLFITDIYFTTDSATPFLVQIKAGATVIFEGFLSTTAPIALAAIESQDIAGSGAVITIVWPTVAGKNGTYKLAGFEQ